MNSDLRGEIERGDDLLCPILPATRIDKVKGMESRRRKDKTSAKVGEGLMEIVLLTARGAVYGNKDDANIFHISICSLYSSLDLHTPDATCGTVKTHTEPVFHSLTDPHMGTVVMAR